MSSRSVNRVLHLLIKKKRSSLSCWAAFDMLWLAGAMLGCFSLPPPWEEGEQTLLRRVVKFDRVHTSSLFKPTDGWTLTDWPPCLQACVISEHYLIHCLCLFDLALHCQLSSLLHKLPVCHLAKRFCGTSAKSVKVSLAEIVPVWFYAPVCVCVCVSCLKGFVLHFVQYLAVCQTAL